MPQQRRPIQFTGDIEDEDVHLDYDPEHVLDSDPDLLRISRRLQDLSNGGALKTRHVRRMLELIKANPQLGPDRALMMAMSEG